MSSDGTEADFFGFRNPKYDGTFNSIESVIIDKDKERITFKASNSGGTIDLHFIFANAGFGFESEHLSDDFNVFTVRFEKSALAIDSILAVKHNQSSAQKEWLINIKSKLAPCPLK